MDLETDVPLGSEDSEARKLIPDETDPDLGPYLMFLDEIGAFASKKADPRVYSEEFSL